MKYRGNFTFKWGGGNETHIPTYKNPMLFNTKGHIMS